MCQNTILNSEFWNARIREKTGKMLFKFKSLVSPLFFLSLQIYASHEPTNLQSTWFQNLYFSSQFRQTLNSSQHTLFSVRKNVLVSCHSAASDSTATAHAGFASSEFSSNLLSNFETEAHLLPFELTTLSLDDFNFHFNEYLSSASH